MASRMYLTSTVLAKEEHVLSRRFDMQHTPQCDGLCHRTRVSDPVNIYLCHLLHVLREILMDLDPIKEHSCRSYRSVPTHCAFELQPLVSCSSEISDENTTCTGY